jgi:hypothetical protein
MYWLRSKFETCILHRPGDSARAGPSSGNYSEYRASCQGKPPQAVDKLAPADPVRRHQAGVGPPIIGRKLLELAWRHDPISRLELE